MKLKIKKGDTVQIIAGNDKGETGRVLKVYPHKMRILVEGVNVRKRHTRPSQSNQQGGILSKEMPVHYSNVQILDSDKNPSRIGVRIEGDSKIRYAKTNDKAL